MARHRHDPFKDLVGFLLGEVMYAVRIEVVREIVNPLTIVDLPRAPASVKGVADYRGEVVPVVDLRQRFGLPLVSPSRKTKWIVLDVTGGRNPGAASRRQMFSLQSGMSGATGAAAAMSRQTGAPGSAIGAATRSAQNRPPMVAHLAPGTPMGGAVGAPPAANEARSQARYAALVVDAVTEVFGLAGGELRPAPPLGEGDDKRGIEGVTTFGSRLVFVLDARAFGAVTHAALSVAPPARNSSLESA